MPCYEYRCEHCDLIEEKMFSKASDAPKEPSCPECGMPMRKLISRSSFVLQGGGWASSGYAKQ